LWVRPVEIVQSQPGSASIVLDRAASTVTAVFENLSGSNTTSLTVTRQTQAFFIIGVSATDPTECTLTSSSGLVSGEAVAHVPQSGPLTRLYCATVAGAVVNFEAPPAQPFGAGDTLNSLDVAATIPSGATGTLGTDYRVLWTVTYTDGEIESYDQPVYVCKVKFRPSPSLSDAARYIAIRFPSSSGSFVGERLRYAVNRAQDMVRGAVLETGRYAHLSGNSGAFNEAGLVALKITLIDEGIYDRNVNVVEYTDQLRKALHGAISQANKQLNYDADGSGTVEASEYQQLGAIPIRRY